MPDRNGWIKCSERMPKREDTQREWILVAYNNGFIRATTRQALYSALDATHWQPLPNPPEET